MPPPAPVYNWTGFYIGFNGGWGWSRASANIVQTGTPLDFNPVEVSTKTNGAVFGGQIGYNYQFNSNWVVGVEGDFDGTGMSKSGSAVYPSLLAGAFGRNDAFSAEAKIRWLATVRGRLGYTWGPGMVYITGGGAWEELEGNFLVSSNLATGTFGTSVAGSATSTKSGWTIGGGFQWMLTPSWIARAEYLYYSFNNNNNTLALTFPAPTQCATPCGVAVTSSNNNINVLRLGLDYKF